MSQVRTITTQQQSFHTNISAMCMLCTHNYDRESCQMALVEGLQASFSETSDI